MIMKTMTLHEAIDAAVVREMREDDRIVLMCTEPNPATLDEFGSERSRTVPIAENSVSGLAVGAALTGLNPIVILRNASFTYLALDQMVNQAAKVRYMTGGQGSAGVTFAVNYFSGGMGMAAQHCQPSYALFAHFPGIKVVAPALPQDAYGLMRAAIRSPDPVLFIEPNRAERFSGNVDTEFIAPIGEAEILRPGEDMTIVAAAYSTHIALAAADDLALLGVSAEVIDLRTVSPLDAVTIRASVRRTGRLIVVDESPAACSIASEVIALVIEDPDAFTALAAPPMRVCGVEAPVPFSPTLEAVAFPSPERVAAAGRALAGV